MTIYAPIIELTTDAPARVTPGSLARVLRMAVWVYIAATVAILTTGEPDLRHTKLLHTAAYAAVVVAVGYLPTRIGCQTGQSVGRIDALAIVPAAVTTAVITMLNADQLHTIGENLHGDTGWTPWLYTFEVDGVLLVAMLGLAMAVQVRHQPIDDTEEEPWDAVTDDVYLPTPTPHVPPPAGPRPSDLRRRRRERAATIPGQELTRPQIKALGTGECVYCGEPAAHADHIRPLSRGGWHHEANLVPACEPCNTGKQARLLVEWMRDRPDLILHGMLTSQKIRATLACELREVSSIAVRVPPANDFVRRACVRHGRPDLIPNGRLLEAKVPVLVPLTEPLGVPFAPIRSDDTHPEIDAPAPKTWSAIAARKSGTRQSGGPRPDLNAPWARHGKCAARPFSMLATETADGLTGPSSTTLVGGVTP